MKQLVLQINSPHVMIIINHAQRLLCFLAFVRNPLCVCTVVCWHQGYIFLSRHFLLWLDQNIWLWFLPFPVSYLSLPWGCSFCSVLVCQHTQCNARYLASLLILDCWSSFSIHSVCPRPNKGSKSSNATAAILRLLHICRQFHCHYC